MISDDVVLQDVQKLSNQIEERFALSKQMQNYFRDNPMPEEPVYPEKPSTDPKDYEDMEISLPKDCITREQRILKPRKKGLLKIKN